MVTAVSGSARKGWEAGAYSLPVIPVGLALVYPFVLEAFHAAIATRPEPAIAAAGLSLAAAFAIPFVGLGFALGLSATDWGGSRGLRLRRLAYASVASPPLFVFAGVLLGLVGAPFSDTTAWVAGWLVALAWGLLPATGAATLIEPRVPRLRVLHGVSAALLGLFLLFHLFNHLNGWLGPEAHAAIMKAGRTVYRSNWIEPLLILLLLSQVATGLTLAARWSAARGDFHRVFQIASGIYLAAFIITHLNSALISARLVHGVETNWAWASGAPEGLLLDAWNIRLLPHYALGVFFILSHMATGLRHVLITHGFSTRPADRLWFAAVLGAAVVAALIVAALLGARL